jgi:hypothetical protein
MSVKQDVLDQLESLIKTGLEYSASFRERDGVYRSAIGELALRAFVTEALATIARIGGESSTFYKMLPSFDGVKSISVPRQNIELISHVVGPLFALRKAVENGYLESLEVRIRGNIHDDILQQAKFKFRTFLA